MDYDKFDNNLHGINQHYHPNTLAYENSYALQSPEVQSMGQINQNNDYAQYE